MTKYLLRGSLARTPGQGIKHTATLVDADLWAWIATAHHFYLVPLLLAVTLRRGSYPYLAFVLSMLVFMTLTIASRLLMPPAENINYGFAVFRGVSHPIPYVINDLPAAAYLVAINTIMAACVLFPTAMFLRRWMQPRLVRSRNARTPRRAGSRTRAATV